MGSTGAGRTYSGAGRTYSGSSRKAGGGSSLYMGRRVIGKNLTPSEERTLRAEASKRGVELSNKRGR